MNLPLRLAVYATPPSPVVLISTVDGEGKQNLAPFGFFGLCSHDPPMLFFGTVPDRDTYRNVLAMKQFVVGIPNSSMTKQVLACADKVENEFVHSGLTPVPSEKVKPFCIKECLVNLECELVKTVETGDHVAVIGQVVVAHVDKGIYSEDKAQLRSSLKPLYHLTRNHFFVNGKTVTVQ